MKTAPLNAITEGVSDAWSTGTELVHDLGTSAVELVTGRKRAPWWRRPGWLALLVVAVVGVGLAIFGWQRSSSTEGSESTPRERTKGAAAAAAS